MAKAKKNGETDAILTERLDVPLDAKEVAALGLELAEARLEHSVLKDEKHAKDKSYNEKLNVLDDKIQELAQAVKDHVKFETVEVIYKFDEKNFEVKIHNKQNGKHIRTRAMDEAEKAGVESRRQLSIFDAQKNGPAEKVNHNGQSLTKSRANKGAKKRATTSASK